MSWKMKRLQKWFGSHRSIQLYTEIYENAINTTWSIILNVCVWICVYVFCIYFWTSAETAKAQTQVSVGWLAKSIPHNFVTSIHFSRSLWSNCLSLGFFCISDHLYALVQKWTRKLLWRWTPLPRRWLGLVDIHIDWRQESLE